MIVFGKFKVKDKTGTRETRKFKEQGGSSRTQD
jgi:hypothetical protein